MLSGYTLTDGAGKDVQQLEIIRDRNGDVLTGDGSVQKTRDWGAQKEDSG